MIPDQASIAAMDMDSKQVDPLLPPTVTVPEPARHVNFLTGLLFFWLMPDRCGPHLAAMSIWRALGAYVFSWAITVFMSVLGWAAYIHQMPWTGLQEIRLSAACGVISLAVLSASGGWMSHPVVILMTTFISPQIILMILAIGLMPWCAGGDQTWSVFKRSLKSVYWSTTLLIPFSLVGAALAITHNAWSPWLDRDKPLVAAVIIISAFIVVMTLRVLLGGASRYVGNPEGPAFHPREPLCDECGYRIVGLPLATNCPECGTPVGDSLSGGRRRPTAWQQRTGLGRLSALIQMQWPILRSPDFFKHILVHNGLDAARSFCLATILLVLFVNLGLLKIWSMLWLRDTTIEPLLWATLLMAGIGLITQPLLMFVGSLWAQLVYGIRDYRISAIVCYYSASLMWPLILTVLITCAFMLTPIANAECLFLHKIPFTTLTGRIPIVVIIWGVLSIAAIMFWLKRLFAALRAVRYANI